MRDGDLLRTYRVAHGVSLQPTDDGLAVRDAGWRLARLATRALEADLFDALVRAIRPHELMARHGEAAVRDALRCLRRVGAIAERRRHVTLVDSIGARPALDADDVRAAEADAAAQGVGATELVVVATHRRDPALLSWAAAAREAGVPLLAGVLDDRGAWFVCDDARQSPCIACALLFETATAPALPPTASWGGRPTSPPAAPVVRACGALLEALSAPGRPLPEQGRALVWDARALTAGWEQLATHPSCRCIAERKQSGRSDPRAWEGVDSEHASMNARRFAVATMVDVGAADRPARALYRASRDPADCSAGAFGVALASGEHAELRAVAEAIERFAMLHARPDVLATPACELGALARMGDDEIAWLSFRREELSQAGFRFAPFDPRAPLDWSWARCAASGERLLVPTTLVGRPSRGSRRLVDASSNGYACHTDPELAAVAATLEVVERDALLVGWYLGRSWPRIDGWDRAPQERDAVALLATADVDLPVVVIAARTGDGSLRLGAGAGLSFLAAVRAAQRELDGQLRVPSTAIRGGADLADPGARCRPADHVAAYAGQRGDRALRRLTDGAARLDAAALDQRWPATATESVSSVTEALSRVGLRTLLVDRSLPDVTGPRWHVVRALVPGAVEPSWGHPYRRLASPRIARALADGEELTTWPHPFG